MNLPQLRIYAVRPVLEEIHLWSPTAENLIIGTGLQESNFDYLDQDDQATRPGPAYGFFQIEATTYYDLWNNFLFYQTELRARVRNLAGHSEVTIPPVEDLYTNLALGIAMCRIQYYRVKEALPANEPLALARYWKAHYNTILGAGTVLQAVQKFQRAFS